MRVLTVPPAGPHAGMGSDEVTDYKHKMREGRELKAGRWRSYGAGVCDGRMEAADEAEEFQIFKGRRVMRSDSASLCVCVRGRVSGGFQGGSE